MSEENQPKNNLGKRDELDELFVDRNIPPDKKKLLEILKPFVTLDNEGVIDFSEEYYKLQENVRVLVYLCSKKAMVLKGIAEIKESAGPKEIHKKAEVSENSAKHALYRDFNKLLKKEKAGFTVPNHNLKKIQEIVLGDED